MRKENVPGSKFSIGSDEKCRPEPMYALFAGSLSAPGAVLSFFENAIASICISRRVFRLLSNVLGGRRGAYSRGRGIFVIVFLLESSKLCVGGRHLWLELGQQFHSPLECRIACSVTASRACICQTSAGPAMPALVKIRNILQKRTERTCWRCRRGRFLRDWMSFASFKFCIPETSHVNLKFVENGSPDTIFNSKQENTIPSLIFV